MRTKAVILFEVNKPLVIEEIEVPKLKKGQVLVKITASGVCRRQLNEMRGYYGPDKFFPHLLGHEAAGIVEETGEGVTKVKKGDYVIASWIKGKGLEGGASQYKVNDKIINSGPIATFSQYSVISENRLVKVSKKVPSIIGSILGCAIATGVGIIRNTLLVKRGSSIAIFGVGGVGTCCILGAKMMGCKTIIAVDITKDKLEFAKKLGATHVFQFNSPLKFPPLTLRGGGRELKGVDYAVEASGSKEAMEAAFESLNDMGVLAIAGNLKKGQKISLDPFEFIKGKKVVGSWGGETDLDKDIPFYADEYLSGRLEVDKLISTKYKLEEVNKALSDLNNNKILGRAIIDFRT